MHSEDIAYELDGLTMVGHLAFDDHLEGPRPAVLLQGRAQRLAAPDWTLEVYGAVGHSFTNFRSGSVGIPGLGYDAAVDRRSWRSMRALFADTIGRPR